MVNEIINKAIRTKGVVELFYSKDEITTKYYELCNINYSPEYGDRFIKGLLVNSLTELTFRIDKIKDIQLVWDDVFFENVMLEKDGLYTIMVKGDYLLDYELRRYKKGERLLDNTIGNGIKYESDLRSILAYHYVPFYSEDNKNQWIPFTKEAKGEYDHGLYIFAYTQEQNHCEIDKGYEVPSGYMTHNVESNGIKYSVRYLTKGCRFADIINPSANIIAYSQCKMYYDREETRHWEIAREFNLI